MDGNESPLVFESFERSDLNLMPGMLYLEDPDTVIKAYNALGWIATHRIPTVGPLDIEETAKSLGIPLELVDKHPCLGEVIGMGDLNPLKIVVRRDDEMAHTLGHEIGHIFAEWVIGIAHTVRNKKVEDFCERFGSLMALPESEIATLTNINEWTISGVVHDYRIGLREVLCRLVDRDMLPDRLFIIDGLDSEEDRVLKRVFCKPCVHEYGSCLGMQEPSLTLDFTGMGIEANTGSCKHTDTRGVYPKGYGQLVLEGI